MPLSASATGMNKALLTKGESFPIDIARNRRNRATRAAGRLASLDVEQCPDIFDRDVFDVREAAIRAPAARAKVQLWSSSNFDMKSSGRRSDLAHNSRAPTSLTCRRPSSECQGCRGATDNW